MVRIACEFELEFCVFFLIVDDMGKCSACDINLDGKDTGDDGDGDDSDEEGCDDDNDFNPALLSARKYLVFIAIVLLVEVSDFFNHL